MKNQNINKLFSKRNVRITGVIGIIGATIMFSGDMFLYFTTDKIVLDDEHLVRIMRALPNWRLFLGGILGPIAALFYCIGGFHLLLSIKENLKIISFILWGLLGFTMIVGGTFHSQFYYIGSIGALGHQDAIDVVMKNLELLAMFTMVPMILFSILLGYLILRGKTWYPKWFVIFTPIVLLPFYGVWNYLPQPFYSVIAGGWNNIVFIIYFTLSLIVLNRRIPLEV